MAWRAPTVNMVHPSTSTSHIPVPAPIATSATAAPVGYDPKDRTDPLYLHPNESPALQLVTAQLEGRSNYHPWARAMEMALRSKNKMVIVDGTMPIPNSADPRFFYWDQCNTMVLSWILRALSPTIARSVLWINTAEGIWKDLKKRFSQQDVFRVSEIQAEIHQTKQGASTVNEYFTQLKLLWDELLVLRPAPACECSPSCACGKDLSEKVRVHLENDMLSVFLTGLNENFTNTKRQIMLMKPLPDVGEAFSMVSQQERQVNTSSNTLGDNIAGASAFFTKGDIHNKKGYSNQKPKPVCSFCGYTSHTVEKCYKKHGYPPGWKPRNKSAASANQIQTSLQETEESENNYAFNQEDYRRFLEFMQHERFNNSPLSNTPHVNAIAANFIPDARMEGKSAKPAENNLTEIELSWFLDSGATHHIVCNMHLLQNARGVQGIYVDLPNGQKAPVSHIGSVQLSAELVLVNVLCVPVFHCNLISLGELIRESNCKVLFHSNQCVIQGQHHGRMIGLVELRKGLYQLIFPAFIQCKTAVNLCSFWHARLGHASEGKIRFLHTVDNKICNDKTCCL
ncbi:PREDICTED: uncharacterized protein LOC109157055 [Ipomoea nil]|uniref:uncharacterized protein LOC109157055 n=1 Tax=Ipomoea nil TaxID=35883 RepID=UPI000901528A|nr:PREDICTED: uncharacterized protein LOC109157055 [Ipomoea nil]